MPDPKNEIVWRDAGYLVIRSTALFCSGFNAYRIEGDQAVKINDPVSWFGSVDSAVAFIETQR